MIPKIIHFCWFSGDKYPELIGNCINSWKLILPDYEFVLWDAERIKSCSNLWLEQTLEKRKYAFGADYVRFYALYHYGGVYLDADVEVLKSFNALLHQKQFVGEEASGDIEAAIIGVEKGSYWVKQCLDHYTNRAFIKVDGSLDMRPVPLLIQSVLADYPEIEIYPYQYFSPKNYHVGNIATNTDTYCIHHFDGKWVKKGFANSLKMLVHKSIYLLVGRKIHNEIIFKLRKIK